MERRKFIKMCCITAVGLPLGAGMLESCGTIYYATSTRESGRLVVAKSEFIEIRKKRTVSRKFVLLKTGEGSFPICLYRVEDDRYLASLMKCTHRGCELNVGGGIYTCPCHGSEFSIEGIVLEGPADENLKTFKTETDNENIYVYLS